MAHEALGHDGLTDVSVVSLTTDPSQAGRHELAPGLVEICVALPPAHAARETDLRLVTGNVSLTAVKREARFGRIDNLRHLIIECAFPDREAGLAVLSRHLCPSMLAAELRKLERECEIHITHLKPGQMELTMAEIESRLGEFGPRMLRNNQVFEF